jgi:hypothetical protein
MTYGMSTTAVENRGTSKVHHLYPSQEEAGGPSRRTTLSMEIVRPFAVGRSTTVTEVNRQTLSHTISSFLLMFCLFGLPSS